MHDADPTLCKSAKVSLHEMVRSTEEAPVVCSGSLVFEKVVEVEVEAIEDEESM